MIFKIVPDAKIAWGDVWLGAFVAALLLSVGNALVQVQFSALHHGSPFGAAGSVVVVVVWVYYSAQILFFGAKITQVYANWFGSYGKSSRVS